MAYRCVNKWRLVRLSNVSDVRHFHPVPPTLNAIAVPLEPSTSASTSSSPLDSLRQRKVDDLKSLLSLRTPRPQHVWGSYIELLQFYGTTKVPIDIHQSVLRKCAPPAAHVRASAARRRASGRRYTHDQMYESRFRTIIRNIRSTGDLPTLEDYHCVLELFAAVGNHKSAMMVWQEIGRVGLAKEPRTYALCLQALCHRLTLPIWHLDRPTLVDEVTEHCLDIIQEMTESRTPYIHYNVDLAFRILKETMNMDGFSSLLRNAYGIDLAYPDRPPLEYWDKSQNQGSALVQPTSQLTFSLAAFNTALDFLGRSGNVSKLVQTFEVVINPLPSSSSDAIDDEDDDDFGISNPRVAPYKPPYVYPNTTSFLYMIKWLSRANHIVLARHYVLAALQYGREDSRQLRQRTLTLPPDQITSPRVSVNRGLLLPVLSLANRYKNTELTHWVLTTVKRVARRKRYDIEHYTKVRAQWINNGVYRSTRAVESDLSEEIGEDLPSDASSTQFSTFFNPSSSSHASSGDAPSSPHSPLDVDIVGPLSPPLEVPKVFNIDLHLKILEYELSELTEFETHVEDVLGRTSQRIKERLGRRVWGGKNVFMRDASRRMEVSREVWRLSVNFRPQSDVEAQRRLRMAKMRARERSAAGMVKQRSDYPPHQNPEGS